MLFVYGRKIVFSLICILSIVEYGQCQRYIFDNGEKYDNEDNLLYLGIGLGLLGSNLSIAKSENFINSDTILSVNPRPRLGLSVNSVAMLRLSEHVLLKTSIFPLPNFQIYDFSLDYTNQYPSQQSLNYNISSIRITYPLECVLQSDRINKGNFFFLVGMFYSFDIASNEKTNSDQIFKIKRQDFGFSVGFGIHYFGKHNLNNIEIKYSRGLTNLFVQENNFLLSRVVERLNSQQLTISVNLLGGLLKYK